MGFFKRLSSLFSGPAKSDSDSAYWFTVQCDRCGEKIRGRVDLRNDLSVNYGDSDSDTTYFTRKVLIGENQCYQPIEVELTFDHRRQLLDRQIKNGKFVDEE